MGNSCCCVADFVSLSNSEWIDIVGLLVNSLLAFWIVRTIQNKLTNKRVLKDHFINEVKEIRNEYRQCLSNLHSSKTHASRVIPWFKLMNIKVDDLMQIMNKKYKVDSKILNPYQNELRELITESTDFISQYSKEQNLEFSETTKSRIIIFQQEHNHLFNDLIIQINDSE